MAKYYFKVSLTHSNDHMPYIPHTETEIKQMLDTINVTEINQLFDEIPLSLRCDQEKGQTIDGLKEIPTRLSEDEVQKKLIHRAAIDSTPTCFAGAGAYDHFIPAAVWEITTRGEFYSAYTPYQAEASQGTLQLIYEFQSMVASLTAMDVANASLYDGASALAEAILMAVRANKKAKSKKILIPDTISPIYKQVAETITRNQGIELISIPFDQQTGCIPKDLTESQFGEKFAALIIPLPNYFGQLEDVHKLTNWAHQQGALVIASINPMALGVFEAPGNWGEKGADIVIGEGQPLGIPIASGGPYLGLMACKQAIVRQMPGRIIGKTEDIDGKTGFTLTLQAREQHIRRSKATSNICTNQGLLATASTIYMALMGSDGIKRNGLKSYQNTLELKNKLLQIEGVESVFTGPHFHEVLLKLPIKVSQFISQMADSHFAEHKIVAGVDLGALYPYSKDSDSKEASKYTCLENTLLICATEKRSEEDIAAYIEKATKIIASGVSS